MFIFFIYRQSLCVFFCVCLQFLLFLSLLIFVSALQRFFLFFLLTLKIKKMKNTNELGSIEYGIQFLYDVIMKWIIFFLNPYDCIIFFPSLNKIVYNHDSSNDRDQYWLHLTPFSFKSHAVFVATYHYTWISMNKKNNTPTKLLVISSFHCL